jgi:hypothetical protein
MAEVYSMLLSVLYPRSDLGVGALFLTRELHAGIVNSGCGGCHSLFRCLYKLFISEYRAG